MTGCVSLPGHDRALQSILETVVLVARVLHRAVRALELQLSSLPWLVQVLEVASWTAVVQCFPALEVQLELAWIQDSALLLLLLPSLLFPLLSLEL